MTSELAKNETQISSNVELARLENNSSVNILTGYQFTSIRNREVKVVSTTENRSKLIDTDIVIMSMGLVPATEDVSAWMRAFSKVFVVGDALMPANVAFAVRTGFDAAYCLT